MKVKWYYQVMGEIRGPVDGNDLRGFVNRNEISRDSYVRREQEDWITADRIDELYPKSVVHSRSTAEPKMYYQVMGEIRGPVSASALRRLANTNSINRDTFIRQDNEEWVSADQVPGLLP
jgi:hypothetical protein